MFPVFFVTNRLSSGIMSIAYQLGYQRASNDIEYFRIIHNSARRPNRLFIIELQQAEVSAVARLIKLFHGLFACYLCDYFHLSVLLFPTLHTMFIARFDTQRPLSDLIFRSSECWNRYFTSDFFIHSKSTRIHVTDISLLFTKISFLDLA